MFVRTVRRCSDRNGEAVSAQPTAAHRDDLIQIIRMLLKNRACRVCGGSMGDGCSCRVLSPYGADIDMDDANYLLKDLSLEILNKPPEFGELKKRVVEAEHDLANHAITVRNADNAVGEAIQSRDYGACDVADEIRDNASDAFDAAIDRVEEARAALAAAISRGAW